MRKTLLIGALLAMSVAACADDQAETDDDSSSKSTNTSTSTSTGGQGGNGQGGDQGGNPQGGNPQGGNPQGGNPQGGNPQGGNAEGGSSQGGSAQGGNSNGGSSQGGAAQGGASTGGNGQGGQGGASLGCLDAEDCSMNGSQICDQPSQSCMLPQCTVANPTCPNTTDMCLLQFPNSNNGACYPTCAPFTSNCGVGQDCVDISGEGVEGACFYTGSGTLGQTCTPHDINTGCTAGHFCGDPGTGDECLQLCNFWGLNASCTATAQSCYFLGLCLDTPSVVDPAGIGQVCNVGAPGDDCAKVGDKVNGTCQNDGLQVVCMKNCRMNFPNDCPLAQPCSPYQPPFDLFGVCF
jgi:hypothetical protein